MPSAFPSAPRRSRLLSPVLLLLFAAHAAAQPLTLAQADAAVASASHGKAHAARLFAGPAGLVGVVLADNPVTHMGDIAWLTPDGRQIIPGQLLSLDGSDLTLAAKYDQGVLLRPSEVVKEASRPESKAILMGTSGPTLTVLFDPNCIYCNLAYAALTKEAQAAHVRVRFVMVGTLKETSIPRSASILAAADRAAALNQNETTFDKAQEEGGYPVDSVIPAAEKATVESNNDLFRRSGIFGTPAVLYCSQAAHAVKSVNGLPSDFHALIADASETACATTAGSK
jgi:thiol:disulfide interchange protein DsbG